MFGLNTRDLEIVRKALSIAILTLDAAPVASKSDTDRAGMEALLIQITQQAMRDSAAAKDSASVPSPSHPARDGADSQ